MKVRIEGQPLNSVLGIKSRFVGNGGDECSVEELALQYYAAEAGGSWTGQLNHRLQGPVDLPLSTVLSCFFRDVGIVFLCFFRDLEIAALLQCFLLCLADHPLECPYQANCCTLHDAEDII